MKGGGERGNICVRAESKRRHGYLAQVAEVSEFPSEAAFVGYLRPFSAATQRMTKRDTIMFVSQDSNVLCKSNIVYMHLNLVSNK